MHKQQAEKLMGIVNMADAVYMGAGCAWAGKKGRAPFERWRNKIIRKAQRLLRKKVNLPNFWDNLKGSTKI